uniref:Uncharacterized protein n=1 Tax=Arundo donax TaxID=35708 RepID=A0A0A9CDN8_ARUDO
MLLSIERMMQDERVARTGLETGGVRV